MRSANTVAAVAAAAALNFSAASLAPSSAAPLKQPEAKPGSDQLTNPTRAVELATISPSEELGRVLAGLSNRVASLPKGYRSFHPAQLSDVSRVANSRMAQTGTNTRWAELELKDAKHHLLANLDAMLTAGEAALKAAPQPPNTSTWSDSGKLEGLYTQFTKTQTHGTFRERSESEAAYLEARDRYEQATAVKKLLAGGTAFLLLSWRLVCKIRPWLTAVSRAIDRQITDWIF
jgi:hypothetical protein